MKPPQSDRYNLRVIRGARFLVSLPFIIAAAAYRWVKGVVVGPESAKALREKDQVRQSRVRRTLRGLPPDHQTSATARP